MSHSGRSTNLERLSYGLAFVSSLILSFLLPLNYSYGLYIFNYYLFSGA